MALSTDSVKRLMTATTSAAAGNEIATAINNGAAIAAQCPQVCAGVIIATSTSQTVDFGILAVNDQVIMIPATAGSADQIGPIATAGTLGQAAVVGNLYMVMRPLVLPPVSAVIF